MSIESLPVTHKRIEIKKSVAPPVDPNVKVDRYGHIVKNTDIKKTEQELRREEADDIIERRRETKWVDMFQHWQSFSGAKRNKLRQRIKKGIPDAFRSKAWAKLILNNYDTKDYRPKNIDDFLEGGNQVGYITIEADLARTMPNYPMFNNDKVFNSLRRVLYAYSNRDPSLGYTQGMSAIAGLLLLYMDEATAYDCFEMIMLSPKYGWRHFYLPEFPRLRLLNSIWEEALAEKYPKIAENFKKVNLESLYYTPSWFLTLFLNQDFPPKIKFMIFDRFVEYGSRALISFGLVIVSRNKALLVDKPFESVISVMQKPTESRNMDDWRYVMKKYDDLWIPFNKYKKYFEKTGIEYFP